MTTKTIDFHHKQQFRWGQLILGICLFLFTMFCLLPILLVVISAFTAETEINSAGFTYFPKQWSMDGMNAVLRYGSQLRQSYLITITVTVLGTFLGLLVMSMFAYSISRKDFQLKGFLSVYLLIPMLFSGGQLSAYIFFSKYYGLKDTLWVLILPLCVSTMNVIILRTYIHSSILHSRRILYFPEYLCRKQGIFQKHYSFASFRGSVLQEIRHLPFCRKPHPESGTEHNGEYLP